MTMSAQALIDEIVATRAQVAQDPDKLGRLQALQRWQVERLQLTYADFSADPRHRAALAFFIEDLYGPHDFAQRHRDLKTRLVSAWRTGLPWSTTSAARSASHRRYRRWLAAIAGARDRRRLRTPLQQDRAAQPECRQYRDVGSAGG